MLWSKVKTVFIIIFLVIDIAFLILMGVTSAGTGLTPGEVTEIVSLCERYGIILPKEQIPVQATRLPVLEARFMTANDLPTEVRGGFVFDETGHFRYADETLGRAAPKDEASARRVLNDTLKAWGLDPSDLTVAWRGTAAATVTYTYQNRPMFGCAMNLTLSDAGIRSAEGRWLCDLTVTQGAETIMDAPTVLAELVEEDTLCHRGLAVTGIEIGYFPESAGDGVIHKIFPLSPAYRITLSNGETRTYFALSE